MKLLKAHGKFIDSTEIRNILVQGEKNADKICFETDRFYNDTDISELLFIIKGINSKNQLAEQTLSKTVSDDKVILEWNVTSQFTAADGNLSLEIRGVTNSETDSDENVVIKYIIPSVTVKASSSENLPEPDVITDTLNSIHAAKDEIQQIYDSATQLVVKSPYIKNGVWWIYDSEQSKYINTGISAYNESQIVNTDVSQISSVTPVLKSNTEFRYINGAVSSITISAGTDIGNDDFISSVVFKISGTTGLTVSFDFTYINDEISLTDGKQYCMIFLNDGFGIKCVWYEV